jgi:hypothetical protein
LIWIRIANGDLEIVRPARLLKLKRISELTHITPRNVFHGGDTVKILGERGEIASALSARVYVILNEAFLLIAPKNTLKSFAQSASFSLIHILSLRKNERPYFPYFNNLLPDFLLSARIIQNLSRSI